MKNQEIHINDDDLDNFSGTDMVVSRDPSQILVQHKTESEEIQYGEMVNRVISLQSKRSLDIDLGNTDETPLANNQKVEIQKVTRFRK